MPKVNIPSSQALSVNVSETLYRAMQERCLATGETMDHLVQDALSKSLGVEHHTLHQVSTSAALVQGVYQGCVNVGTIKTHGDFGLGTFDMLDGEGMMLDGHVYQALGDGSVNEPPDSASAPFWVSAEFEADRSAVIETVNSWEELCTHIDGLRLSDNLFTAIRIDGVFDDIHYRVACQSAPGTDLVTATSHQAEFKLQNISGTLIGFWSPVYARTFNIPGYHLHLLSSDHRHGGHILGIRANHLKIQVMDANQLTMALPESPDFLKADLSADPAAALKKAEGAQAK
ncbi:acetolactate decarboxylase [Zwartia sp.]|uniref:acetolactate decarboxylase n=1 Tax=Zwartia sp. TaxID=2978004 RepID=UPI003BB0ADA5